MENETEITLADQALFLLRLARAGETHTYSLSTEQAISLVEEFDRLKDVEFRREETSR